MYLDSPVWHLKVDCPCCNQRSCLLLYSCGECDRLTAVCDEMFTMFLDPLNISLDNIASDSYNKICPNCGKEGSLKPAKDYEILKSGLSPKDYE